MHWTDRLHNLWMNSFFIQQFLNEKFQAHLVIAYENFHEKNKFIFMLYSFNQIWQFDHYLVILEKFSF